MALVLAALVGIFSTVCDAHPAGDFDNDGYVGLKDYRFLEICMTVSGPESIPAFERCVEMFDSDGDEDVDLGDYGYFQRVRGHLPIPLKDMTGNILYVDSTQPYCSRHTCGGCHNLDVITNGFLFQQGRTDTAGDFIMKDDYYGDGRWWTKSSGRYGKWGQSFRYLLAAKENANASEIDQTAFAWVRDCGGCHPGGGPGEFDRDGELLYDETTGKFGYELQGETPEDVVLDGDYCVLDYPTGSASPAPWDVTGLSGPDCLRCHRAQRTVVDGVDMNFLWRTNTLASGAALVNSGGEPVPAFAAANTAGQGWFYRLESADTRLTPGNQMIKPLSAADAVFLKGWEPAATATAAPTTLQIDYSVGVANGSLLTDGCGAVFLSPASVTWPPKDQACWSCHPYGTITGTVWFNDSNVHYRKFNNLNDDHPGNDIPPSESRVCTVCHIGDLSHNFGRGNSFQIQYRNDLDWKNQRHCRSCHLTLLPNGEPNPGKHPDAPDVPGDLTIHVKMEAPRDFVSCQGCHIPRALTSAVLFRDITIPGAVGTTSQYYSANPLNPSDPDKSRWYPALLWKEDVDGVMRLFPANIWIMIYWGDWHQNGTPGDRSDDVIAPIPVWRISQLIPQPLPVVTDDNGDGQLEINRPEEILAYIQLLKGNDGNGRQVAANPVLVRGKWVWYEDRDSPHGINCFQPEAAGIPFTWYPYIWGMDHNVRPKEEAWGYAENHGPEGCRDCHRPATHDAPVSDRLILVDPYSIDGRPVYETVRQMTGANPP